MQKQLAYLLFAKENAAQAQQIMNDLRLAQVDFISNPPAYTLEVALKNQADIPVLLLLSDNYLKSSDAAETLQVFMQGLPQIFFPILTDGQKINPQTLQAEAYPTQIATIHDVMQYRDFWYDEWIRLRKVSMQVEEGTEQLLLEHKKNTAKKMSTHIHSFLRSLSSLPCTEFKAFVAEGYQQFFEQLGRGEELPEARFPLKQTIEPIQVTQTVEIVEETPPVLEEETPALVTLVEPMNIEEHLPQNQTEEELNPTAEKPIETETTYTEPLALPHTTEEDWLLDLFNLPDDLPINDIYENIVLEEVRDLDALFLVAEAETEEGSYTNAQRSYERILELDPSNGRALLWLARLLARHIPGGIEQADTYYKRALLFSEPQGGLFYEYALLQLEHYGNYRRAIDLLCEAQELQPQEPNIYLALAKAYAAIKDLAQAKAAYLQAYLLDSSLQDQALEAQLGILRPAQALQTQAHEQSEDQAQVHNPNAKTTVLVTGASSGIGAAVAELFALNGYKVILTGRRAERLLALKQRLESRFQVQIHCLAFDVRNQKAVVEALNSLPDEFQDIDILVNNAGLAKGLAPIHRGDLAHWETMIDTNLKGLLYLTRAIAPHLVAKRSGHIINIGSVAGKQAYPNGNVYCATKAAVDMLTETMRMDLYPYHIRVSAVHPGYVETEFALVRFDDAEKAKIYEDFTPLTAQDVADLVYFIATRPRHVNIQDTLVFCTQQASATLTDRSGKLS